MKTENIEHYWPNGHPKWQYIKEDGTIHGEVKRWHENGQLQGKHIRVHGKYHGLYQWWHNNGQIAVYCFCHDDKIHGEYKAWGTDGEIRDHRLQINGSMRIDFLHQPQLYPNTESERLAFMLKYNVRLLPENTR